MTELINLGFDTLSAFCEVIILFSVFEHLTEKRFSGRKQLVVKLICAFIMTAVVTLLCYVVAFFSFVTLLVSSFMPALLVQRFCRAKITDVIAVSMLYYLIITIGGILVSYIIEMLMIPEFTVHIMKSDGWERALYIVVSKLLLIAYYFAYVRMFNHRLKGSFRKIFPLLMICSLWYYFMIAAVLNCVENHNLSAFGHSMLMVLLFMVIALVTALILIGAYCFAKEKKIQNSMEEYQKIILKNNYLRLNRMYKGAARGMHDYKNHMLVIRELLSTKSYSEAETYVSTLCDSLRQENFAQTYTGVEIVDAVLNVKQNEGINYGIKTDIRASYPHSSGIVSVDICTILGNLLDNAIEACAKVTPKENRRIGVRISYTENVVMIKIENTVDENPFVNSEILETTKKERTGHGLGISIVKKVLEKYHGDLKQMYENGMFISKVILYSNSNIEIDGQKSPI